MPNFDVDERIVDTETLFERKVFFTSTKSAITPAVATLYRDERPKDTVHSDARGIGELYRTVTPGQLEDARIGEDRQIQRDVERQRERARPGEVVVGILAFRAAERMDTRDIVYMVGLLSTYADVMAVPLQPDVLSDITADDPDGDDPADVQTYVENTERVVEVARELCPDMPLLGTIPPVSRAMTLDLLDLYLSYGVRGFCVNFDGGVPTSIPKRDDVLRPLVTEIGRRNLADDVFVYGVNAHRGRDTGAGPATAENFLGLGLGPDVLGGYHVQQPVPADQVDGIYSEDRVPSDPATVPFRVFDPEEYVYRSCWLADLDQHVTEPTGLDIQSFTTRLPGSRWETLARLRRLVNVERMGLAATDLAAAVADQQVVDHLRARDGVGPGTVATLRALRDDFDASGSQTGLGDF